jgi:hypothetical protein
MTCGTSAAAWRVMFTHAAIVAVGSVMTARVMPACGFAALGDLHGLVGQVGERGLVLHVLDRVLVVTAVGSRSMRKTLRSRKSWPMRDEALRGPGQRATGGGTGGGRR